MMTNMLTIIDIIKKWIGKNYSGKCFELEQWERSDGNFAATVYLGCDGFIRPMCLITPDYIRFLGPLFLGTLSDLEFNSSIIYPSDPQFFDKLSTNFVRSHNFVMAETMCTTKY